MKIITQGVDSITGKSVCGLGGFDGVHLGHQAIVNHLKKLAYPDKKIGIITFIPLPIFILNPTPIFYLTSKKEKEEIFRFLGIDFIYYFKFNEKFAKSTPSQFVKLIATKIKPSIIVAGENFNFGRERSGSAQTLKELAKNAFSVDILPMLKDDKTISSTRIRELLLLGHIKAANRLLGREYLIMGRVIKGKGKGAKLGFPTINLKVPREKLLPLDGVYKVRAFIDDREFLGAMFCRYSTVEVHLINFSGDLYRREVAVKILARLRDIKQFTDDSALKMAIAFDVKEIRN